MRRFNPSPSLRMRFAVVLGIALFCGLSGSAQTTTTTTVPLTPAQEKAQARAAQQAAARQAAAEKQAAAKQAAADRQAAAKEAATEKRGAATNAAGTANSAARTGAATKAAGAKAQNSATSASSASTAAGNAARPGAATAPTSSASKVGTSGTVGTGTLAWGPRVYSSSGCVHNGSSAVCTFTFVNQGNEATVNAGGAGELSGIQLVDDAHVPHRWASAHFLDKYGTQQPRLLVQPGDSGTYVVTFGDVNPQVSSAEFHLRGQIVGGITFAAAQAAAASGAPAAASPATSSAK